MPSLQVLRQVNATLRQRRPSPVVVVIGATGGIGEATAHKFAEYAASPRLLLVGRSAANGANVVDALRKANPAGEYTFHPCDFSLFSEVRRLAAELRGLLPKVDLLVMTPGILTTAGRTETAEGHDNKLALHYYSRVLLARELLPLLRRAAEEGGAASGQKARVLSVLDAVNGDTLKLNWDDLDLRKKYSLSNAANHACGMTDAAMQHLAVTNPSVTFIHISPGFVATNLAHGLPWYVRPIVKLAMYFFAVSPAVAAESMMYALVADEYKDGWALLNNHADRVKAKSAPLNEEITKRIWDHTGEIIGK